jgi:GT2 family glycosyltransferase
MPRLSAVSVVIPSHDGLRFLRRCIPALRHSRLPSQIKLQMIVVDNGSHDGSREWLRAQPDVEALIYDRPLGFSHANNAARCTAQGDVVAFLNNDTEVDPDWLTRPLAILRADPLVAAVGSRLLYMQRFVKVDLCLDGGRVFVRSEHYGTALDSKARWIGPVGPCEARNGHVGRWVGGGGATLYLPLPERDLDEAPEHSPKVHVEEAEGMTSVRVRSGDREEAITRLPGQAVIDTNSRISLRLIQNAGSFVTRDADGGDVGSGEEDSRETYGDEAEVPSICGAALIARRSALDAAGWFPSYYTMYYEDTDLCLRLRQAGSRLVYCPSSVVLHYHTGTNREYSPRFIQNVARSTLLFAARFGDARLLARRLGERLKYSLAEMGPSSGRKWWKRWGAAYGLRGALSALPAMPRVLAERCLDALRRRPMAGALLGTPRSPYLSKSEVQE